jgi:Na+/H+ antiporter NhaC
MGAACDHIDHVKTQIPYALTVGLASIISYIVAGFTGTAITLVLALALVVVFTVLFSKIWGARMHNLVYTGSPRDN